MKMKPRAIRAFEKAIGKMAQLPGGDHRIARLALKIGHIDAPALSSGKKASGVPVRDRMAASLTLRNGKGVLKLVAADSECQRADLLERAARIKDKGRPAEAVELRKEAVDIDPRPERHLALAESFRRPYRRGQLLDVSSMTVLPGKVPWPEWAVSQARAAHASAPSSAETIHMLGKVLAEYGDPEEALIFLRLAALRKSRQAVLPDFPECLHRAGTEHLGEAFEAYMEIYHTNSKHVDSLLQALRLADEGVTLWPQLWAAAVLLEGRTKTRSTRRDILLSLASSIMDEPSQVLAEEFLSYTHAFLPEGTMLHPSTMNLLVARMQAAGFFAVADRIRVFMAHMVLQGAADVSLEKPFRYREVVAAHARLGDVDKWLTTTRAAWGKNFKEAMRQDKFAADAELIQGGPALLRAHLSRLRLLVPAPGDQRMRALVEGKEVLIITPGADPEEVRKHRERGSGVVVRIGRSDLQRARKNQARSEISYLTEEEYVHQLNDRDQDPADGATLLVVHPDRKFGVVCTAHSSWLRVSTSQYSLSDPASLPPLVKTVYDLAQFQPSTIRLVGCDARLGLRLPHHAEQRQARADVLLPKYDMVVSFRLMKALHKMVPLRFDDDTSRLLDMENDDYLRALETVCASC